MPLQWKRGIAALILILFLALVLPMVWDAMEKARFQGTWSLASVTVDGTELPEASVGKWLVKIDGDRVVFDEPEARFTARFAFDRTAEPKSLELTRQDPAGAGEARRGIYAIRKNHMQVCLAVRPGAARPDGFSSADGSGRILVELVRRQE